MKPTPIHPEYYERVKKYCVELNCSPENFEQEIRRMYQEDEMSCPEIAEKLSVIAPISARTVLSWVKLTGPSRPISKAFPLAASRGRIKWAMRERSKKIKRIPARLRFAAKCRDNFECTLCGPLPETGESLEVVRISGESNDLSNLRTLCNGCNEGGRRLAAFPIESAPAPAAPDTTSPAPF